MAAMDREEKQGRKQQVTEVVATLSQGLAPFTLSPPKPHFVF